MVTDSNRCILIIEPTSNRLSVNKGSSVYESLLALNYPLSSLCGGLGKCGKCIIQVLDPNSKVSDPNDIELKLLTKEQIKQGYRLACQTKILGDSRIYITDALLPKGSKILIESDVKALGINIEVKNNPLVYKKAIKIKFPSFESPIDDYHSLLEGIKQNINPNFKEFNDIDNDLYKILKELSYNIRKNDGTITLSYAKLENQSSKIKILNIETNDTSSEKYGLAVDIGTTTIVGYLIDLNNCHTVAISALLNPQVSIGEDLISRITYIVRNNAILRSQELLIEAINKILKNVCEKGNVNPNNVVDIVVVGNTGMHHMFFGLPPEFLAKAPFVPVCKSPINISSEKLNLICNPRANLYSPPVIAGYVGTDTIGCILSSRIDQYNKYTLLLDIGTNGELVIGNKDGLITGSCAAGSALEGAHIKYGMRAAEGAIEDVKIDPDSLEPKIGVIGNIEPRGICGSGFIDIIAEMLKSRILTRSGKFNIANEVIKNNKRIIKKAEDYHYILYKKEWDYESLKLSSYISNKKDKTIEKSQSEITISQNDIRQIQLAKGAFLSGANILLDYENKLYTQLEQVVLAGAFGTYINKKNAAFIGLIPDIKSDAIYQIGNAAGLGAQLCIRNLTYRTLANSIAYQVKYYEIASSPKFQKEYAYSLYFPHYDLSRFPNIEQDYKSIPFK